MITYPRAVWLHVVVAILGGLLLGIVASIVAMRLSLAYWGYKDPHDGQTALGVVAVGLFSFPVFVVALCTLIFVVQRRWSEAALPFRTRWLRSSTIISIEGFSVSLQRYQLIYRQNKRAMTMTVDLGGSEVNIFTDTANRWNDDLTMEVDEGTKSRVLDGVRRALEWKGLKVNLLHETLRVRITGPTEVSSAADNDRGDDWPHKKRT